MTDQVKEARGPSVKKATKGDTFEILRVLLIAVVSFGVGFALIYLFFGPSSPGGESAAGAQIEDETETSTESAATAAPDVQAEPVQAPSLDQVARYAPQGAGPGYELGSGAAPPPAVGDPNVVGQPVMAAEEPVIDRAALPAAVPPGKTPEGMAVDGDAFYLKCWDSAGVELKGEACDQLNLLEKRFATRLYVIDKCRIDLAGAVATGKLSLGMEVDFTTLSVSFWNGPSSDLPSADDIARCLKTELRGLPIDGVPHKNAKYRMFFTVLFGNKALKAAADKPPQAVPSKPAQTAPTSAKKGKTVKVIKDRVRVRKTPVDGEEIGKIGVDNEVQFLGRQGEWCEVVTPAGNQGWMICDALGL